MSTRDTAAEFGLIELIDTRVTLYKTPLDYIAQTGKTCKYDPNLSNKYWASKAIITAIFSCIIPRVNSSGDIDIDVFSFPNSYAQSVNIPSSYQDPLNPETLQYPIVQLREEEYLVNTPFGIKVRNRDKFANVTATTMESKIYNLLQLVASKLGIEIPEIIVK